MHLDAGALHGLDERLLGGRALVQRLHVRLVQHHHQRLALCLRFGFSMRLSVNWFICGFGLFIYLWF